MNFLKQNWFKLGILAIGIVITYSFYQVFIIQPRAEREEEKTAEETLRSEAKGNLERCIADAKDVLRTKKAIDDEFCAKCDGYVDNYTLQNQCLDGCLELSTKSLNEYKETERTCFQRFSTN